MKVWQPSFYGLYESYGMDMEDRAVAYTSCLETHESYAKRKLRIVPHKPRNRTTCPPKHSDALASDIVLWRPNDHTQVTHDTHASAVLAVGAGQPCGVVLR